MLAATTIDQALQRVAGHAVGHHDNFPRRLVADEHISVSATDLGFYHEPYETYLVEGDRVRHQVGREPVLFGLLRREPVYSHRIQMVTK